VEKLVAKIVDDEPLQELGSPPMTKGPLARASHWRHRLAGHLLQARHMFRLPLPVCDSPTLSRWLHPRAVA
jgi:hypothetical protein